MGLKKESAVNIKEISGLRLRSDQRSSAPLRPAVFGSAQASGFTPAATRRLPAGPGIYTRGEMGQSNQNRAQG